MFKVSASQTATGTPLFITIRAEFDDRDQAWKVATSFPKSLLVGAGTCHHHSSNQVTYTVNLVVNLQATKGNARNDNGIKRYKSFLRHAAKNGFDVEFTRPNAGLPTSWAYMTEEDLEAAIS